MLFRSFQGGSHGNFLEFVCNVISGVKTKGSPFNSAGASHLKSYLDKKIFDAGHFSSGHRDWPNFTKKIISIRISSDDLLPLSQISLLRAGDYGLENDELEFNTYHKLNNTTYKWVLTEIESAFFEGQIEKSYNAVKDPSWPDVKTMAEFTKLPTRIKDECIQVHKLFLLELNEHQPHCPRNILREFFQIGFEQPSNHGFLVRQQQMKYDHNLDVFEFNFSTFYNEEEFLETLKKIAHWADLQYNDWSSIKNLHQEFLSRQPYRNSKIKCDKIVENLINNTTLLPKVNLIEEAYINAKLKLLGHECRY